MKVLSSGHVRTTSSNNELSDQDGVLDWSSTPSADGWPPGIRLTPQQERLVHALNKLTFEKVRAYNVKWGRICVTAGARPPSRRIATDGPSLAIWFDAALVKSLASGPCGLEQCTTHVVDGHGPIDIEGTTGMGYLVEFCMPVNMCSYNEEQQQYLAPLGFRLSLEGVGGVISANAGGASSAGFLDDRAARNAGGVQGTH